MRNLMWFLILCLWVLGGAHAQTPAAPSIGGGSGLDGLTINLGVQSDLGARKSGAYHDITYNGDQVLKGGTENRYLDATHNFANAELPADPANNGKKPDTSTDSPVFKANLAQGAGELGGGIFNLLGTQKFTFGVPGLSRYGTRLTGGANGTLDGKSFVAQAGVELFGPNLNALGLNRQGKIANWLLLGAMAQRQTGSGEGVQTTTKGVATYRAFIGRAYGWHPNKLKTPDFTADDILKIIPDLAAAKQLAKDMNDGARPIDKLPTTRAWKFAIVKAGSFLPLPDGSLPPGLPTADAEYKDWIRQSVDTFFAAFFQEPDRALWLEATGYYAAVGDPGGARFRPTTAFIATWWRDFSVRARSQLQVRYDVGYGDEATYRRLVSVSLGLVF